MTRKQKTIGVVIAVAVLAAAGISYAVASSSSGSTGKQVVVLSTVQRRTLQGTVNLTGTLARKETTKVTAATQGLVSDVSVKDGSVSKTGRCHVLAQRAQRHRRERDPAVLPLPGPR